MVYPKQPGFFHSSSEIENLGLYLLLLLEGAHHGDRQPTPLGHVPPSRNKAFVKVIDHCQGFYVDEIL